MYLDVTLIGNLGSDPEMRYTENGVAVTSFPVATTKRISKTNSDGSAKPCPKGWKESYNNNYWELTTWVRVTVWRGLAETCNRYLAKGKPVFVKGELNGEVKDGSQYPRVWTGKDGSARASYELTASIVKFLGSSGNGGGAHTEEAPAEPPPGFVEEDELPF